MRIKNWSYTHWKCHILQRKEKNLSLFSAHIAFTSHGQIAFLARLDHFYLNKGISGWFGLNLMTTFLIFYTGAALCGTCGGWSNCMVGANIEQPLSTELKPSHPPFAVKVWHLGNPTLLCSMVSHHINHEGFENMQYIQTWVVLLLWEVINTPNWLNPDVSLVPHKSIAVLLWVIMVAEEET